MAMEPDEKYLCKRILERFLRYVRTETTSDRHSAEIPSTSCQWDLLHLLERELKDLGLDMVELTDKGYLIARLESNITEGNTPPAIGFIAHVDTSQDAPGKNVNPKVIENYDLKPIALEGGQRLDPQEFSDLKNYRGETIITSDGNTLLGADDKAGIAEIITALEWLKGHTSINHGPVEVIFTPDEETGKGLEAFPLNKLKSKYCYTIDGGGLGIIESECFFAYKVEVNFKGISYHLGEARGKLVNAVSMAGCFVNMLPRSESPEATDGKFGYYCPIEIKGDMETAYTEIYLRDFKLPEIERRIETIKNIASTVESLYPGGKVELNFKKQYSNMKAILDTVPEVISNLEQAVEKAGLKPEHKSIRGGTDGARLSEMGIPTPNVFNGGYNYHSRLEWASLFAMGKASRTIINLIQIWAEKANTA